ncbi:MAG: septum site-determining protein MinC [Clostridia bacterium]|nr:septum site-determining protein MinC [Clostridia bacterium]
MKPKVQLGHGGGASPQVDEDTILVQRTLRSGQSVHYAGNVVVLGDVNPGAEIIASGNIIIMGALRGVAHAGVEGNEEAVVTAFRLQPTQLRIANHITRAPDGNYPGPDQPETARIKNGEVIIEAYQPAGERSTGIC